MLVPHEIHIGEVFIPPMLLAGILGLIAASVTAKLLNKYRLSKFFIYPPLAMVAFMIIFTILFGWIVVPF